MEKQCFGHGSGLLDRTVAVGYFDDDIEGINAPSHF